MYCQSFLRDFRAWIGELPTTLARSLLGCIGLHERRVLASLLARGFPAAALPTPSFRLLDDFLAEDFRERTSSFLCSFFLLPSCLLVLVIGCELVPE